MFAACIQLHDACVFYLSAHGFHLASLSPFFTTCGIFPLEAKFNNRRIYLLLDDPGYGFAFHLSPWIFTLRVATTQARHVF